MTYTIILRYIILSIVWACAASWHGAAFISFKHNSNSKCKTITISTNSNSFTNSMFKQMFAVYDIL